MRTFWEEKIIFYQRTFLRDGFDYQRLFEEQEGNKDIIRKRMNREK